MHIQTLYWMYRKTSLNVSKHMIECIETLDFLCRSSWLNVSKHLIFCIGRLHFEYRKSWLRDIGWRRLIGSPNLQIIFHKRATKYRSLLRKMTYKDKGSYESLPPCIAYRIYSPSHLECHSISISKFNFIALFSTEHGIRNPVNLIIEWDMRLRKWHSRRNTLDATL